MASQTLSTSRSSKLSTKRNVVLVDDHAILLERLQQMIDSQRDLRCSAIASNGNQALRPLQADKPDLFTVDISMPGRSGLELIKEVVALHKDLPILVLSMHDEGLYAQRALKAGARGYVMKEANSATLLHAMRTLLNGDRYLSPAMSACLLDAFSGKSASRTVHGIEGLSDREFEVFRLLGVGQGTADVAKTLNLSPKTVDVHRANIRTRLNLKNGGEVMRYAVRWVENQKLGISL